MVGVVFAGFRIGRFGVFCFAVGFWVGFDFLLCDLVLRVGLLFVFLLVYLGL